MQENKKTWNVLSINAGVVSVVLATIKVGLAKLEARDFSSPDCNSSTTWTWMNNAQSMNPCKTVAYLQGACHGTTFQVTPLPNNSHYDPGAASTADSCYCSWATYNLLSACTLCQDEQNGILPWAQWNSSDCAKFTSTTGPWPPEFNNSIPNHITFPNWAAKDPRTWTDGRWNAAQALQGAQTDSGDYYLVTASPTQTTKSEGGSDAGAITGGVVGGVVALAVGMAIAVFLLCRTKRRKADPGKNRRDLDISPELVEYHHSHSPSGGLSNFYRSNSGYTPLGHVSSPSNGSVDPSTFMTHASDQQSVAQESLRHTITASPSPGPLSSLSLFFAPQPQAMVSPFIRQNPTASATTRNKKLSEVSHDDSIMNEILPRRKFNPPAYLEAPGNRGDFSSQNGDLMSTIESSSFATTPSSSAQQTRHQKNVSATLMTSAESHLTHPSNQGYWIQPGATTFSGAADLLNYNDTTTTTIPTLSYITHPPGTSMSPRRNEKQRLARPPVV